MKTEHWLIVFLALGLAFACVRLTQTRHELRKFENRLWLNEELTRHTSDATVKLIDDVEEHDGMLEQIGDSMSRLEEAHYGSARKR